MAAYSDTGSALLLTWQNFRVLIPGGVPQEHIKVEETASLSLLLLEKRDLEGTDPAHWLALAPRAVIATAGYDPPTSSENWFNISQSGWFAVQTDGNQRWMEKGSEEALLSPRIYPPDKQSGHFQ